MKRVLLAALCVLALILAGFTTVNQTNSFVDLPTAETQQQTENPTLPAVTQPPVMTPAATPAQTTAVPDGPQVSPAPSPEESPAVSNGLNG